MTWFYWVWSWQVMISATSLTPTSTSVRGIQFSTLKVLASSHWSNTFGNRLQKNKDNNLVLSFETHNMFMSLNQDLVFLIKDPCHVSITNYNYKYLSLMFMHISWKRFQIFDIIFRYIGQFRTRLSHFQVAKM